MLIAIIIAILIVVFWFGLIAVAHILRYLNEIHNYPKAEAQKRFKIALRESIPRNLVILIIGSLGSMVIIGILFLAVVGAMTLLK